MWFAATVPQKPTLLNRVYIDYAVQSELILLSEGFVINDCYYSRLQKLAKFLILSFYATITLDKKCDER